MSGTGNASAIQLRRIRETTQNVLPGGAMQAVNFESFQITGPVSREATGDVTANGQVTDNPATDLKVSGTGKADLKYSDLDPLWEQICCAAMATGFSLTATTISAVASGNKIHNTAGASYAGLGDGDLVLVTGFATNPAVFLGHVSGAPTTNDLSLDSTFITLVDETAGSSITVQHAGRFRFGTSTLTDHWEEWNTSSSVGNEHGGIGVSQAVLSVPAPSKCTTSWTFTGIASTTLAAQFVNTTTPAGGNPVINSNRNFLDLAVPTSGFGFRYGVPGASALQSALRIKSLTLTITRPLDPEGSAGTLGPVDISLDDRFGIKLEIEFLRNTTAAETLLTDAKNPNAVLSIGFGFKDSNGKRLYIWLPAMQPSNSSTSGLKQKGRETGKVEWMAKADGGVTGMFQMTKFN